MEGGTVQYHRRKTVPSQCVNRWQVGWCGMQRWKVTVFASEMFLEEVVTMIMYCWERDWACVRLPAGRTFGGEGVRARGRIYRRGS